MSDRLKDYEVEFPITATSAFIHVRAASEDEAIAMAYEELTNEDFEWQPGDPFVTYENEEDGDVE